MSSETVRVIRDILPGVNERTLRELRALIAYSLAAPSSAELREQRLGLLVQIVARDPARIPLGEEYETERGRRAPCGEEWPSRSQLSRAYGSWLHAVSAAMELIVHAPTPQPPATRRAPHPADATPAARQSSRSPAAEKRSAPGPPKATIYSGGASCVTPGAYTVQANRVYPTSRPYGACLATGPAPETPQSDGS